MHKLFRLAFWICLVAVLALSLSPGTETLPSTGWDKTNHLLGFGVLTFLACMGYPRRIVACVIGLTAFGGLIEVLQSFTPDRQSDWADILADVIGIAVGLAVVWMASAYTRKKSS